MEKKIKEQVRTADLSKLQIKQMMDGGSQFNFDHTKAIFEDKKYTNLTNCEDRPFEIEAREAERKYFKQVLKLLKEKK